MLANSEFAISSRLYQSELSLFHCLCCLQEKCGGNTVINSTLAKYCQQFEQPTPQTSADDREQFIKNKYELKIYTKPKKINDKAESAKRIAHYFLIVGKDEMILPDLSDKDKNQKGTLRYVIPSDIFKAEYNSGISFRSRSIRFALSVFCSIRLCIITFSVCFSVCSILSI